MINLSSPLSIKPAYDHYSPINHVKKYGNRNKSLLMRQEYGMPAMIKEDSTCGKWLKGKK